MGGGHSHFFVGGGRGSFFGVLFARGKFCELFLVPFIEGVRVCGEFFRGKGMGVFWGGGPFLGGKDIF